MATTTVLNKTQKTVIKYFLDLESIRGVKWAAWIAVQLECRLSQQETLRTLKELKDFGYLQPIGEACLDEIVERQKLMPLQNGGEKIFGLTDSGRSVLTKADISQLPAVLLRS